MSRSEFLGLDTNQAIFDHFRRRHLALFPSSMPCTAPPSPARRRTSGAPDTIQQPAIRQLSWGKLGVGARVSRPRVWGTSGNVGEGRWEPASVGRVGIVPASSSRTWASRESPSAVQFASPCGLGLEDVVMPRFGSDAEGDGLRQERHTRGQRPFVTSSLLHPCAGRVAAVAAEVDALLAPRRRARAGVDVG